MRKLHTSFSLPWQVPNRLFLPSSSSLPPLPPYPAPPPSSLPPLPGGCRPAAPAHPQAPHRAPRRQAGQHPPRRRLHRQAGRRGPCEAHGRPGARPLTRGALCSGLGLQTWGAVLVCIIDTWRPATPTWCVAFTFLRPHHWWWSRRGARTVGGEAGQRCRSHVLRCSDPLRPWAAKATASAGGAR